MKATYLIPAALAVFESALRALRARSLREVARHPRVVQQLHLMNAPHTSAHVSVRRGMGRQRKVARHPRVGQQLHPRY